MESSDAIASTTVLQDLAQWDSLAVVSIIAMLDNDYNLWLSGNDIRESKTVGDLFSKINRKTE
ncbi:MAG: acyl carrier protein [Pseudobdellovibrionaceae bacterium]